MENTLGHSERYIGIDLHTNRFNSCIINKNGQQKKMNYDLTPESLGKFISSIDKNTYVMLEASVNSFKFYDLIKDKAKEVIVGNTHKLKLISFVDEKTDKIDAEKIAKYLKLQIKGEEKLFEPVYVPEQKIRELRSLFTTYGLLNKQIRSTKNRIHSILKQNMHSFYKESIFTKKCRIKIMNLDMEEAFHFQIELLFGELDFLENKKEKIIEKIMIEGSKYIKEIDILTSMTGISVLSAIAIISDAADISRFPNQRKFTSYLRSTPGVENSNETTKHKKTSKFGRGLTLSLITQSYAHFKNGNPRMRRYYNKSYGKKKNGTIRMAIFRNVFTEIFHMLNKKEYHWYRNEILHQKKMNEYYKILEKNGVIFKEACCF